GLGAIGIVEIEDRRLREDVGGAEAGGVIGVALDLGWPPHVAFDQNRLRVAAKRNRAREEERATRNDVLGLFDVRNDFFGRLLRAGRDARERERRGHELQELAAALRVVPLGGLFRKLA